MISPERLSSFSVLFEHRHQRDVFRVLSHASAAQIKMPQQGSSTDQTPAPAVLARQPPLRNPHHRRARRNLHAHRGRARRFPPLGTDHTFYADYIGGRLHYGDRACSRRHCRRRVDESGMTKDENTTPVAISASRCRSSGNPSRLLMMTDGRTS